MIYYINMKHKKLIFIIIFTILIALPESYIFSQGDNLEIKYPVIPGEPTPPTVISMGLPNYIKYIFNFSIAIIGIIIFGVLIYSGFQYIISTGSPEKLGSAKKGITSALIGIVVLFSAALLFNTINPELTKLETPDLSIIEPVITPGIYLCNYKIDNIANIISRYTDENATENELIEVAREFKTKIRNGSNICFRVAFSGNLSFTFDSNIHDGFAIPRKEYISVPANEENPTGVSIEWKYDYGIIFHEKDNFRGECYIGPAYDRIVGGVIEPPLLNSRSVTLFEKPAQEPGSDQKGVTLYQCLDYNKTGSCPAELGGDPADKTFPEIMPADDATFAFQDQLGNLASNNAGQGNVNGTRSIQIDQEGSYFAVLFSENDFKGDICEVINEDDNNLLDQPIGQCEIAWDGHDCTGLLDWNEEEGYLRDCKPCTNSLVVIKGNIVK